MYIQLFSLIFLLVIGNGYCCKNEDCKCDHKKQKPSPVSVGDRQSYEKRIIGGNIASIEDHPHHVQVKLRNNTAGKVECGGSIISRQYIISAGHCWTGRSHISDTAEVIVGSNVRGEGELYTVENVFVFPNIEIGSNKYWDDYLLLKLEKHLNFNSHVQPVKLGSWSDITDGVMADVTGFGLTENGSASKHLRVAKVPIMKYCKELLLIHEFCAGYEEGGISAYKGDSGGGLVVAGKLIGIVSHRRVGEEPGLPKVYSSIPYAAKWICHITGICASRLTLL